MEGFSDEIEKLGGVIGAAGKAGKWALKSPWRRIGIPAFVGAAGYAGAKASGGDNREIAASSSGPSRAWYINYHKALGLPKKMTKLEREHLSRNFARYRERK